MKGEKKNKASFHIQLLSKIIEIDKYPLIKLIIENNINEEEYQELMELLEVQNEIYIQQKEEGFLNFSSLLIEFAGMLNEKLDPDETIAALKKEDYYPDLMDEFIKIIDEEKKERKRSSRH